MVKTDIAEVEAAIKMLRRLGVTKAKIPLLSGDLELEMGPEPAVNVVDTSVLAGVMSDAKKKFEQRDDGLTDEQAKMLYVGF